jgi:hypothetical protein
VRHGNLVDRYYRVVLNRRWGLGILPLAEVAPRWPLTCPEKRARGVPVAREQICRAAHICSVTTGTPIWPVCTALMVCAHNLSDTLASQCGDGPWLPANTDTTRTVFSVVCL